MFGVKEELDIAWCALHRDFERPPGAIVSKVFVVNSNVFFLMGDSFQ